MKGGKAALLASLAAAAAVTTVEGTSTATTTTTTTTTTTSSTDTSTAAATSTSTSTTTTSSFQVPTNYTVRKAADYGVKCDGVTDDTAALQAALNKVASYDALSLPAGTCVTSWQVRLYNKQNVIVFGAGSDQTIIKAVDPAHSAFVVSASSQIALHGFAVISPNSTSRLAAAPARGFYIESSHNVSLTGLRAEKIAAAGFVMWQSADSEIKDSTVVNSLADAFHITGASQNILVQNNTASGSGDDCFASIGYGTSLNSGISFVGNTCSDNAAAGVSFEGTNGGKAYNNLLTRTGGPGIRIASKSSWNTGAVSNIDLASNVLTSVRTHTDVDASAIFVLTSLANISNITFRQNRVVDGNVVRGRRLLNYSPTTVSISNVSFDNETDQSATKVEQVCLATSDGVSSYSFLSGTLNSLPCESHT